MTLVFVDDWNVEEGGLNLLMPPFHTCRCFLLLFSFGMPSDFSVLTQKSCTLAGFTESQPPVCVVACVSLFFMSKIELLVAFPLPCETQGSIIHLPIR